MGFIDAAFEEVIGALETGLDWFNPKRVFLTFVVAPAAVVFILPAFFFPHPVTVAVAVASAPGIWGCYQFAEEKLGGPK